jgi:hypothetical protein
MPLAPITSSRLIFHHSDLKIKEFRDSGIQEFKDNIPNSPIPKFAIRNLTSTVFVHSIVIVQILSCFDLPPPSLMGLIPFNGLTDPLFKRDRGAPSQFSLDLREVNGISTIVAQAICDKSDQGMGFSQPVQNGLRHFKVRPFTSTPNIVNLPFPAVVEDRI